MTAVDVSTLTEAFSFAEAMAEDRASIGVLVFSATLQLLYMNRQAQELTRHLHEARTGYPVKDAIPLEVMGLCEDLVSLLQTHPAVKDWEQVQRTRVTMTPRCPMLLRGFGIPHAKSSREGRLVVLMEELHAQMELSEARVQERYRLTDREQTIVAYLLQGLTNKAIANRMELSEHTVKDHLRHIMKKTNTTTRTGLLARILFTAAATDTTPTVSAISENGPSTYQRAS